MNDPKSTEAMPPNPTPEDRIRIDNLLREVWSAFDEWDSKEKMLARTVWWNALLADRRSRGADEATIQQAIAALEIGRSFAYYAPDDLVRVAALHKLNKSIDTLRARLRSPAAPAEPAGKVEARLLTDAATDVLAERQRQIDREGYAPEHDDEHDGHEIAHAAACYAYPELVAVEGLSAWPWDDEAFKVKDHRGNYVRAAALLLAEIERLDRAKNFPGISIKKGD